MRAIESFATKIRGSEREKDANIWRFALMHFIFILS